MRRVGPLASDAAYGARAGDLGYHLVEHFLVARSTVAHNVR